jgi:predicted alpha/beta-fold hydrolase
LYDFDDQYTAPAAGFENAADYYARCSAAQFVSGIEVPTLILTARDDPLVPVSVFEKLNLPDSVVLHISEQGGHLGYIAKAGDDPDRRWMDWRIVDWMNATTDEIPQSGRTGK